MLIDLINALNSCVDWSHLCSHGWGGLGIISLLFYTIPYIYSSLLLFISSSTRRLPKPRIYGINLESLCGRLTRHACGLTIYRSSRPRACLTQNTTVFLLTQIIQTIIDTHTQNDMSSSHCSVFLFLLYVGLLSTLCYVLFRPPETCI